MGEPSIRRYGGAFLGVPLKIEKSLLLSNINITRHCIRKTSAIQLLDTDWVAVPIYVSRCFLYRTTSELGLGIPLWDGSFLIVAHPGDLRQLGIRFQGFHNLRASGSLWIHNVGASVILGACPSKAQRRFGHSQA